MSVVYTERAYFGVGPSSFVTPGDRYRLAFRDVLALYGGIRDPKWLARVNKFIEVLPGSTQLAYPFPPAAIDEVQRVAVVDVQLMSNLPGLQLGAVMDRVAAVFPDAHLLRVRLLDGPQSSAERSAGQAGELAAAAARDVELDAQSGGGPFDSLLGWAKGAGMWVVIVLALVLGIVYFGRRGSWT